MGEATDDELFKIAWKIATDGVSSGLNCIDYVYAVMLAACLIKQPNVDTNEDFLIAVLEECIAFCKADIAKDAAIRLARKVP